MNTKSIIIIILIAVFLIVLLQNTQVVELRLLFWKITMSRVILFPLTLLIGFVIGYITAKLGKRKEMHPEDSTLNY
jgi:lipopolysaccharide assembly protein A